MNKKKLLRISEISKFTGASPRSLRYYERLGLLEPAYIDPDSGYRYYSFDQVYHVDMIQLCIELDIPLKVLKQYVSPGGVVDTAALVAYGKQIAETKLGTLKRGIAFLHKLEQNIALAEQYQAGRNIYTRQIPEMLVYAMPLEKPLAETDPIETARIFQSLGHSLEDENLWWDFGLLAEHTPLGTLRYVFMELREEIDIPNVKRIPGGSYFCMQNDSSMIEQVSDLFSEQLKGKDRFVAVEVEIFTGEHKIVSPVNELRVLVL